MHNYISLSGDRDAVIGKDVHARFSPQQNGHVFGLDYNKGITRARIVHSG